MRKEENSRLWNSTPWHHAHANVVFNASVPHMECTESAAVVLSSGMQDHGHRFLFPKAVD